MHLQNIAELEKKHERARLLLIVLLLWLLE